MPQLREDQAAIHVQITDPSSGKSVLDRLVWASMDGGDLGSTDTKTRPGGMGAEKNLGGPPTRSDCTVERQYTNDVLHPLIPKLERLVGAGAAKVSWTPLDAEGNPAGATESITGILKEIKKPKWDANASAAAFLTLTIGCDATPSVIA